ncbi:hypothetical protein PG993_008807 [Apiospora rasikravindrae]|uniref:Nephrocystin 3-like N-terminal domain-containing protein n=1 Tax=Apiospora rasikravindrae TaxID=990691 RepID=A0ABR1SPD5_9PEZI
MEALEAIGLASNLLQFIELGFKLAAKAKDIHQSSSGSTEEDASHLRITTGLEASFSRLTTSTSKSHNEHEAEIHGTASECADVARQLSELLEKTRVKGPRTKTKVFKATIKSTWKSKEKQDLVARLDHALNGLNSQLLLLTRSDIITHLDRSFEWHTLQGTQLQSISTQVNSLRRDISKNRRNTAIVTELCEVLEKPRQSLVRVRQHQILRSLRFDSMHDREEGISEAHETTYDWILEPEGPFATSALESTSRRFRSWLQQDGGIFFIMGKPGAGKSVLMKTISDHENFHGLLESASHGSQIIVAKFFFWNAGSDHQKSFQGLVRSLLHSILSEAPDLIPAAFPKEWEETKQFSGQSWTAHHDHKKINAAFEELLRSELLYRDRKIVFLIDGLDELEGDHHHMVERIRSWSTTGGANLKICVSSREWNVFTGGFSDCDGLQLQMLTHEDMFRTARDTLAGNNDFKRLEVSAEELEVFAESLVEKAEGVFLWTTLVLRLLQDGLSDGDEMRQLQKKLEVLPTELEDLFEHMLTSIRRGDQAYAFKMIYFVSACSSGDERAHLFRMLFLDLLYEEDHNSDPAEELASECQVTAKMQELTSLFLIYVVMWRSLSVLDLGYQIWGLIRRELGIQLD